MADPVKHAGSAEPVGRSASHLEGNDVVLWLDDAEQRYEQVRLWSIVSLVEGGVELSRVAGGWQARLSGLPVARLEYLFEVRAVGREESELILDPGNPREVPGAFGPHSWLPLPGYSPPGWLERPSAAHVREALSVPDTPAGEVQIEIWSPADAAGDEALPLLLSHDGAEMDAWGGLTQYVGALVRTGELPRMRVALLAPGPRNQRYAANPDYADALVNHVLPALAVDHPTDRPPVLIGQSLGGLAALHAEWNHPGTFGGIASQSGSFFTPELDQQMSSFERWTEITDFVQRVLEEEPPSHPAISITCGTAEENLANNRLLAQRLQGHGLEVAWGDVADGHSYTTWRDLLDPHLRDLLAQVWS